MAVNALAYRLINAVRKGDYSTRQFEPVCRLQRATMRADDRLVSCSIATWRHHELWNAWVRVWALGAFLDQLRLSSIYIVPRVLELDQRRGLHDRLLDQDTIIALLRWAACEAPDSFRIWFRGDHNKS